PATCVATSPAAGTGWPRAARTPRRSTPRWAPRPMRAGCCAASCAAPAATAEAACSGASVTMAAAWRGHDTPHYGDNWMTTRTMGPLSGWRWLARAVNLGGGNPRAVLGGATLLALVALLPSVIQLVVQNGLGVTSVGA